MGGVADLREALAALEDTKEERNKSGGEALTRRAEEPIPDSCFTGAFYIAPKLNDQVDGLAPLNISWDMRCLGSNPKHVDIYLYAPGRQPSRVNVWSKVPNQKAKDGPDGEGHVELQLMPRWWDAVQDRDLSLTIIPHNMQLFENPLPPGPVFKAAWEEPKDGEVIPALDTNAINLGTTVAQQEEQTSKSKIAAGVLVPLILIGLAVAVYFKWKRKKQQEKSNNYAEALDRRMSTISTDWKSVTPGGAQAAIRNSMAVGRNSMAPRGSMVDGRSSFSFGNIRPSSVAGAVEGGDYDEKGGAMGHQSTYSNAMKRPGVGLRQPSGLNPNAERGSTATRVSRVSFAEGTRPSGESRRTGVWRDSGVNVPPVPHVPSGLGKGAITRKSSSDEDSAATMSPTQTVGAMTLTPEDIRARIAAGRARAESNAQRKSSFERDVTDAGDDMLPALQMMRATNADEYLYNDPAPPAAAQAKPVVTSTTAAGAMSPVINSVPMQPASVMTPDDMLRAYAERKKSVGTAAAVPGLAGSRISYPAPMSVSSPALSSPSSYRTSGITVSSSSGPSLVKRASKTGRSSLLGALGFSSSSPSQNAAPLPTSSTMTTTTIQAPQQAATIGPKDGGRNIFSGSLSPEHTGQSASGKEPTLGFAPGEYDANFSFGQQQLNNGNGLGLTAGNANGHVESMYSTESVYGTASAYDQAYGTHGGAYAHAGAYDYSHGTAQGYDATHGGAQYAIGEYEEDNTGKKGSKPSVGGAGEAGFAGRGAFKG